MTGHPGGPPEDVALVRTPTARPWPRSWGCRRTPTAEDLIAEAGRQLGARLAVGSPRDRATTSCAQLIDQGFLALRGRTGAPPLGGPGQSVAWSRGASRASGGRPGGVLRSRRPPRWSRPASPVVPTRRGATGYPFVATSARTTTSTATWPPWTTWTPCPGGWRWCCRPAGPAGHPEQGGELRRRSPARRRCSPSRDVRPVVGRSLSRPR